MSAFTRLPMRSALLLIVATTLAALTVSRWLEPSRDRPPPSGKT